MPYTVNLQCLAAGADRTSSPWDLVVLVLTCFVRDVWLYRPLIGRIVELYLVAASAHGEMTDPRPTPASTEPLEWSPIQIHKGAGDL